MKVNIVCNDHGWIYDQFITAFKKYSKYEIVRNKEDGCDINYFLPYYEFYKSDIQSTTWMSHQEKSEPLHSKFINVAKAVDVAISHSYKYAKMLRVNHDLNNVMNIIPGVDLEKFRLRNKKEIPKSERLIVGYIGRQYTSSDRKNPKLLDKISKLGFIDFRTTAGKLKQNQIPAFYRGLHVTISPAFIEGGPMATQESLACGVPIICMDNVGVANEFDIGVIKAKSNDHFIQLLKEMYKEKTHITHWSKPDVMKSMREQVEKQTWKKFVEEHDKVWDMITEETWKES